MDGKLPIRGLRNPMNSWAKSDSHICDNNTDGRLCESCPFCGNIEEIECNRPNCGYIIGENDHTLMMRMNFSPEESKYRRMITVTMDVVAPLYWWKEFDTYKVGTVCNSCSTMHKIHAKEFTLDDFSHEHLFGYDNTEVGNPISIGIMQNLIDVLNYYRDLYLKTKDKSYWWQMIQLLPSSYNQKRTVQLNYEVLTSIYRQR